MHFPLILHLLYLELDAMFAMKHKIMRLVEGYAVHNSNVQRYLIFSGSTFKVISLLCLYSPPGLFFYLFCPISCIVSLILQYIKVFCLRIFILQMDLCTLFRCTKYFIIFLCNLTILHNLDRNKGSHWTLYF